MKFIEAIVMTLFGVVLFATGLATNYSEGTTFGGLLIASGVAFFVVCLLDKNK